MGWSLINRRMEASSLPPGAMAESCCAFSRRVSGRLPRATRLSPAVTHRRRAAAACYAPSRPVTGRLPGIISSCVLTAEAGGEATIDGVPFAAKTRGLFGGEVQCAGRTVETRTRAWYGIEHILTPRLGSDRIIHSTVERHLARGDRSKSSFSASRRLPIDISACHLSISICASDCIHGQFKTTKREKKGMSHHTHQILRGRGPPRMYALLCPPSSTHAKGKRASDYATTPLNCRCALRGRGCRGNSPFRRGPQTSPRDGTAAFAFSPAPAQLDTSEGGAPTPQEPPRWCRCVRLEGHERRLDHTHTHT